MRLFTRSENYVGITKDHVYSNIGSLELPANLYFQRAHNPDETDITATGGKRVLIIISLLFHSDGNVIPVMQH